MSKKEPKIGRPLTYNWKKLLPSKNGTKIVEPHEYECETQSMILMLRREAAKRGFKLRINNNAGTLTMKRREQ